MEVIKATNKTKPAIAILKIPPSASLSYFLQASSYRQPLRLRLPGLHHSVEQSRLALLDDGQGALDRRSYLIGISDGAFGVPPHALRQRRVVDVGIIDGGADVRRREVSVMAAGHPLQMHHFLVIRTVV